MTKEKFSKIKILGIEIQTALQALISRFDAVVKGIRQFERAIGMSQTEMKRQNKNKLIDIHELWSNNTRYTQTDSVKALKHY